MWLLVSVAVFAAIVWYVTEPWERAQVLRLIRARLHAAAAGIGRRRRSPLPLQSVLVARTPLAVVTPLLAVAQVVVFVGLLIGSPSMADPEALLGWGASLGTRTANGEWWRLVTSAFVHPGLLQLAVNLVALVSVGRVLERLVGPFALAAVYVAAALMGGVVGLALTPVQVVTGASAAIFGLYGLLIASWMWGALQRATTTIRLGTVARLAPAAAGFVVYHTSGTGVIGVAEQLAIATGFFAGVVLSRCAAEARPPLRKIAVTLGTTACLAVLAAVPLRGISDVAPEFERLAAMEARHVSAYDRVLAHVTRGRAARATLLPVIESTILPELQEARTRLKALAKVPAEHRPLLDDADTYLRLRDEAWRIRADAHRRSSMPMLRQADEREQAALAALRRLDR